MDLHPRDLRTVLSLLALLLVGVAPAVAADPTAAPRPLAAIEAEFREAIRQVAPATVACVPWGVPRERAAFSSGVIVSPSGWVLSDGDAGLVRESGGIRQAWNDQVEVLLSSSGTSPRRLRARVVHRDRNADTSLLKISAVPAGGLPHVRLGESDAVRIGEFAFAVGTAFDEEGRAPPTTTAGVIASVDEVAASAPGGRYAWLYTSAAVNQGVNGGPLVDVEGRLIGTVSTFVQPTPEATHQFLGKVVPVDRLRAVHARVPEARAVFVPHVRAARMSRAPTARALAAVFQSAARRAYPWVVSLVMDRARPLSGAAPVEDEGATIPRYQGPVSGIVVSADGWILTSLYNLTNVGELVEPVWDPPPEGGLEAGLAAVRGGTVCFGDGVVAPVRMVGHDRRLGVALLRADLAGRGPGGGPYRPLVPEAAPPRSLQAGRFVLAVGNPFGPHRRRNPLLTMGILSRFHPTGVASAWRGQWQTDAAGLDTNAGGGAVDLEGRLLGLFTIWHPARHGRNSGVAFVVPWTAIRAALPALERGQGPVRGFLGVSFAPGRMPRVAEVIAGQAAESAGIRRGDVIHRIDQEDVTSVADVMAVLGFRCRGDRVRVLLDRDGALQTISAVLGPRPPGAR